MCVCVCVCVCNSVFIGTAFSEHTSNPLKFLSAIMPIFYSSIDCSSPAGTSHQSRVVICQWRGGRSVAIRSAWERSRNGVFCF